MYGCLRRDRGVVTANGRRLDPSRPNELCPHLQTEPRPVSEGFADMQRCCRCQELVPWADDIAARAQQITLGDATEMQQRVPYYAMSHRDRLPGARLAANEAAYGDRWDALSAALAAAGAGWEGDSGFAWHPAGEFITTAVRDAITAVVVRDRITEEQFDTLYQAWSLAVTDAR